MTEHTQNLVDAVRVRERALEELERRERVVGEPGTWMGLTRGELQAEIRGLASGIAACRALEAESGDAFGRGVQLGAEVEQRVAREAVQQLALRVLGKDRGDGAIDLGALGREVFAE